MQDSPSVFIKPYSSLFFAISISIHSNLCGKAPQELVDLIGYNPVVELDKEHFAEQVADIIGHLEDYQDLVDKNREMALKHGDWKLRVEEMKGKLVEFGYEL